MNTMNKLNYNDKNAKLILSINATVLTGASLARPIKQGRVMQVRIQEIVQMRYELKPLLASLKGLYIMPMLYEYHSQTGIRSNSGAIFSELNAQQLKALLATYDPTSIDIHRTEMREYLRGDMAIIDGQTGLNVSALVTPYAMEESMGFKEVTSGSIIPMTPPVTEVILQQIGGNSNLVKTVDYLHNSRMAGTQEIGNRGDLFRKHLFNMPLFMSGNKNITRWNSFRNIRNAYDYGGPEESRSVALMAYQLGFDDYECFLNRTMDYLVVLPQGYVYTEHSWLSTLFKDKIVDFVDPSKPANTMDYTIFTNPTYGDFGTFNKSYPMNGFTLNGLDSRAFDVEQNTFMNLSKLSKSDSGAWIDIGNGNMNTPLIPLPQTDLYASHGGITPLTVVATIYEISRSINRVYARKVDDLETLYYYDKDAK